VAEISDAYTARPERKSLQEALRLYWKMLVGVAIFPAFLFVGSEFFSLPFEFFIFPFWAVFLLAGWPHFSGRAPCSFSLVAIAVGVIGGFLGVLLLKLIRAVTG